jgi:uncharacterized membrane protein
MLGRTRKAGYTCDFLRDVERLFILCASIKEYSLRKEYSRMEKPVRSLIKAISWRLVATLTTIFLVFVFSKDLALGTVVGIAELVLKTLIYYIHERVWNLSNFGREVK